MRSRLMTANKQILDFMHNILDEMHHIRASLTIVQNYIAVLEFNETNLRDSLKKLESKNLTTRSMSVNRIDQIENFEPKRFSKNLVLEMNTFYKNDYKGDDLQAKVNKLMFSIGKIKSQKDRAEIETERLLLQLKQTKEQLALAEENAGARELRYEKRIKKLNSIINKLKETPFIEEIVNRYEEEFEKGSKKPSRTRSNIILYNRS